MLCNWQNALSRGFEACRVLDVDDNEMSGVLLQGSGHLMLTPDNQKGSRENKQKQDYYK